MKVPRDNRGIFFYPIIKSQLITYRLLTETTGSSKKCTIAKSLFIINNDIADLLKIPQYFSQKYIISQLYARIVNIMARIIFLSLN